MQLAQDWPSYPGEAPTPAHLQQAAQVCLPALRALADRPWTVPTERLEWDVRTTVAHVADALGFYALHLAARHSGRLRFDLACHSGTPNEALIAVVGAVIDALALIAANSPRDARGWHFHGMADRSGFVAMGCSELLVHTDDALQGLGFHLDPPDDVCEAVVERLFPGSPSGVRGWNRLLWATGRLEIPGHGRLGPDWRMRPAPMNE